jgi:hypothetical protein
MSVEERLAILEREIVELKRGLTASTKENWIDKIKDSFKGDPEFGEILRLGKEIRQADQIDNASGDA